jgi:hypothetical protein
VSESLTLTRTPGPAVISEALAFTVTLDLRKEKVIASARAIPVNDARSARPPSVRVNFFIIG